MEILFSEAEIRERTRVLGREISAFYEGQPLTIIALLNGALIFAADLARAIRNDCCLDCMAVSSYTGHDSSGELCFRCETKLPVSGRHVLLVDGVLDTGFTLSKVVEHLAGREAVSVRSCVLVEKNRPRLMRIQHADWCAFHAPDRYLVGCGLDSHEHFRQLPYIAAVD